MLQDAREVPGAVRDLQVDSICAPGCRPVGRHFTVTRVEKHGHHNLVLELDHQPAHLAVSPSSEGACAS